MNLKLTNIYTDEEIVVKNVTSYEVRNDGTRVYTELNCNRDMTTYVNFFVPSTIADELSDLFK